MGSSFSKKSPADEEYISPTDSTLKSKQMNIFKGIRLYKYGENNVNCIKITGDIYENIKKSGLFKFNIEKNTLSIDNTENTIITKGSYISVDENGNFIKVINDKALTLIQKKYRLYNPKNNSKNANTKTTKSQVA